MRIAFPAMVLMACSSPAKPATPPTTRPPDAGPVAVSPCVLNGSVLSSYADGAMILCGTDFSIEGGFTLDEFDSDQRCSAVHAGGRIEPAPVPIFPYPYADAGGQTGKQKTVQICAAEDACTTFTPALDANQQVVDAELDRQAQRVVLSIYDPDGGPSAVEVWDLVTQTRIAGTKFATIVGVDYLGDTIFVRHARGEDVLGATMFRIVTGKQPKLEVLAEIEFDVLDWAMVGPNHVAVATGAPLESIAIYDLTTGALLGSSSWRSLVGASYDAALVDEDSSLWIHIAGEHDAVSIYVSDRTEVFLGAGVVTPIEGGDPVPYPFRLCPP